VKILEFFSVTALLVLLMGCASPAVPQRDPWPEPPPFLMEPAEPLEKLPTDQPVTLSDVARVMAENYTKYNLLVLRYQAWQQWAQQQQNLRK
jgi:hypothetical protein